MERHKRRVAVFSFDPRNSACAYYRLLCPFTWLKEHLELDWAVRMDAGGTVVQSVDMGALERCDAVVIQRFFPLAETADIVATILNSGKPVVYETDDYFFSISPDNPTANLARRSAPFVRELLPRVTATTVPTPALAMRLAPLTPRVCVLPNYLDPRIWPQPSPRRSSGPLTIGYAGSVTHAADLLLVEEALLKILDRYPGQVRLRLLGCATPRLSAHPGCVCGDYAGAYETYARTLLRARLDIGLAPLADTEFNRCKSAVKWLEYSAAGCAGVFQDLEPYECVESGRTGLKVGPAAGDWYAALEIRQEMIEKHSLNSKAGEFLAFYQNLPDNLGTGQSEPSDRKNTSSGDGLHEGYVQG